jgi:hypothetical protein
MTEKQFHFLKSLLIEAGLAHPVFGLRSDGRKFCGLPASATSWEAMRERMTSREASQAISELLARRGEKK